MIKTQKERIDDERQTLNNVIIKLSKEKTQKERIDKGRQAFNDEIIRCSESDNLYEAILEWEFTGELDHYSRDSVIDIDNIKENLIDAGRPDMADKLVINEYGDDYGSCICGKNNLRKVFYIQNKINKTVLPTGSDCIFKVFPDGSITKKDILLLDKIIKSSERSVKKIREENKNLKTENKVLVQRNTELILENKKLKSKIEENRISEEIKSITINKTGLLEEIESLKKSNLLLKQQLAVYKKIYGSQIDREFNNLLV